MFSCWKGDIYLTSCILTCWLNVVAAMMFLSLWGILRLKVYKAHISYLTEMALVCGSSACDLWCFIFFPLTVCYGILSCKFAVFSSRLFRIAPSWHIYALLSVDSHAQTASWDMSKCPGAPYYVPSWWSD